MSPRVLFDLDVDGRFPGSSRHSESVFEEHKAEFFPFHEAWVFDLDSPAPTLLGFFRPGDDASNYPLLKELERAYLVLIDEHDNQMWFDGVSCGYSGEGPSTARSILKSAGFDVPRSLSGYDEMHFIGGKLVGYTEKRKPRSGSIAGEKLISNGHVVSLIEIEWTETTANAIDIWTAATQLGGWLGRPVQLTLYPSGDAATEAGYYGHHLIALGSSGREVWMKLPETAWDPPSRWKGDAERFAWMKDAPKAIFHSVGMDIYVPDPRPRWRQRVFPLESPGVIQWKESENS